MILGALAAFALLDEAAAMGAERPVYEVVFAPLPKWERAYASIGPVGPFYPETAVQARQNGQAILQCVVGPAGALEQCAVVSESPRRYYFGAAATLMANRKRITAPTALAIGETVQVRVPFELGAPAPVAP